MDDFLKAIVADLDNDAPRLVYADHLQAQGDPRGEFIVVQCELAKLGLGGERASWDWIGDALADEAALDDGRARKLLARQKALMPGHEAAYLKPLAKVLGGRARLERGFVEFAEWMPRSAGNTVEQVFGAIPTLQSLAMMAWSDLDAATVADTFANPRMKQLRWLGFRVQGDFAQVASQVRDTHLTGLRGLSLANGEEALRALARASFFAALERLDLHGAEKLSAGAVATVLGACGRLTELHLRDSAIGAEGAALLAGAAKLDRLDVLSLLGNGVEGEGVAALAGSTQLQKLRALDLRKNRVDVEGAKALGSAFPELRVLDLTTNKLGEKGVAALAGGDGLGKLRHLCLQQCGLDDAAAKVLAGSKLARGLKTLSLRTNKIGDEGVIALTQSDNLSGLQTLNLNNNPIGERGRKALDESKSLAKTRIAIGR